MATLVEVRVVLEPIACFTCGMAFAVPDSFSRDRLYDGQAFYCPVGHRQIFTERNELSAQIKSLEADKANLKASYDRLYKRYDEAAKETKRLRRRARAGLCLSCNRHFENLERHNKTKHEEAQR